MMLVLIVIIVMKYCNDNNDCDDAGGGYVCKFSKFLVNVSVLISVFRAFLRR